MPEKMVDQYIEVLKQLNEYLEARNNLYPPLIENDIALTIKKKAEGYFNTNKQPENIGTAIERLQEIIERLSTKTELMRQHIELEQKLLINLQINREAWKNTLNRLITYKQRN